MVVVSVSLAGKELKEFDFIVERKGYSSRSDAAREAFHRFVMENRWVLNEEDSTHLLISLIYNDRKAHRVLDIFHDHSDIIHSSSHTHVNHKCVDQIVLKGKGGELKDFLEHLAGVKDVRISQSPL